MHFRGFDSSIILVSGGGIPRPMGEFPGKFDASNVSRRNVSRRIGRTGSGFPSRSTGVTSDVATNLDCLIRAFRACPLVEIRRAVPCRAMRGSSISVNSTLLSLLLVISVC